MQTIMTMKLSNRSRFQVAVKNRGGLASRPSSLMTLHFHIEFTH
jgi:hypothetical protein